MSVNGNYIGGLEGPTITALTTTSATTVVSGQKTLSYVSSIALTNDTASPVTAKVYFDDGSTDALWYKISVPANETAEITNFPISIIEGQGIKVEASASSALTIYPVVTLIQANSNQEMT